jgi:hypothetical protein
MIKIGIDYSLISPALCIHKDGEYKFISFFDDYGKDWKTSKLKKFFYHRELSDIMELIPYTRELDKENYRSEQKTKMKSAKLIAELITNRIKEEVGDDEVIIGIEGFSYGSVSSNTIDLCLYNSFLRLKLLETFGEECIVIISPTEGKKTLFGKGNAKKDDMINSFINNRLEDKELENNPLWKYCVEHDLDFNNVKPIDDLVDSYGILKSI